MIEATNISFKAGQKYLVQNANVHFNTGELVAIMGPNGAGKTTLLKLLTAAQKPSTGHITFKGQALAFYSSEQLAAHRGVLSQSYQINFPVLVEEVIMMGRYPYFQLQPTANDKAICNKIIEQLGIKELMLRDYNSLSGGEAQKVQMARVLAQVWEKEGQSGKALFLDEPVSSLDVRYQHEILGIARQYARRSNTVIAILHDINLALHYADRIYFMKNGSIVYEYQKVIPLDINLLQQVFDIKFEMIADAANRTFVVATT